MGNVVALVMVDQFTKSVECIPPPSQTAEDTATAAVNNEFLSRFGFPFQILMHQGRNFEGKLFRVVCELLQVRTTPNRP